MHYFQFIRQTKSGISLMRGCCFFGWRFKHVAILIFGMLLQRKCAVPGEKALQTPQNAIAFCPILILSNPVAGIEN